MDIISHLQDTWEMTLEFISRLILLTLAMFALWLVSFGLLAPVTLAGYTQSLLLMMRQGRDPQVKDLFSMLALFLPLLGFALLLAALAAVGYLAFVAPGIVFTISVTFVFLFVIPLMTDRKLKLWDAVRQSWAMARRGSLKDHFIVVIIYLGILAIGHSTFIGALFTQPLATVFMLSVYEEKSGYNP
jgi:hypothetical protein